MFPSSNTQIRTSWRSKGGVQSDSSPSDNGQPRSSPPWAEYNGECCLVHCIVLSHLGWRGGGRAADMKQYFFKSVKPINVNLLFSFPPAASYPANTLHFVHMRGVPFHATGRDIAHVRPWHHQGTPTLLFNILSTLSSKAS